MLNRGNLRNAALKKRNLRVLVLFLIEKSKTSPLPSAVFLKLHFIFLTLTSYQLGTFSPYVRLQTRSYDTNQNMEGNSFTTYWFLVKSILRKICDNPIAKFQFHIDIKFDLGTKLYKKNNNLRKKRKKKKHAENNRKRKKKKKKRCKRYDGKNMMP